jgi:hypothetical protein
MAAAADDADRFFNRPVVVGPPDVGFEPAGGPPFYVCRACLPAFMRSCHGPRLRAVAAGLDYLRHHAAREHNL